MQIKAVRAYYEVKLHLHRLGVSCEGFVDSNENKEYETVDEGQWADLADLFEYAYNKDDTHSRDDARSKDDAHSKDDEVICLDDDSTPSVSDKNSTESEASINLFSLGMTRSVGSTEPESKRRKLVEDPTETCRKGNLDNVECINISDSESIDLLEHYSSNMFSKTDETRSHITLLDSPARDTISDVEVRTIPDSAIGSDEIDELLDFV